MNIYFKLYKKAQIHPYFLQIGVWQSYQEENNGLDIKDIVWPGSIHLTIWHSWLVYWTKNLSIQMCMFYGFKVHYLKKLSY